MDMKIVSAVRKYDTLMACCKIAQEKVKGALQTRGHKLREEPWPCMGIIIFKN
jgi:hypothetical protein